MNMIDNDFRVSGERLDLRQLITSMFPRPWMYAASYNLEGIATFIQGFAFGNDMYAREMREFNRWLAKELKFSANIPWWVGLQKRFPDNDEALEELPKLFEKFWKENPEEQLEVMKP